MKRKEAYAAFRCMDVVNTSVVACQLADLGFSHSAHAIMSHKRDPFAKKF
jgi:hypothetical protein